MDVRFHPRELDIMGVLWTHGPSTVAEVQQHLDDDLAYTTVLTMLRTMEGKGYVSRVREGRAHVYTAEVAREAAGDSALRRVVDGLFRGSPEELLVRLVDSRLDADQLRNMKELVDRRLKEIEGDE